MSEAQEDRKPFPDFKNVVKDLEYFGVGEEIVIIELDKVAAC